MKYIIGIDETGRGPWLGPVCAVAFCFNPKNKPDKNFILKLGDSKKISSKKREELYKELIEMSRGENPKIFFGLGLVDNFIIDEINIKQANKEAMRRAILELSRKIPNPQPLFYKEEGIFNVDIEVFIDGRDNYNFEELKEKPTYIIGGDGKIPEIGAASIISKVFKDKILEQYDSLYPDLGIKSHKGYGTKKHKEKLKNSSFITGIHRLTYKPIKKILENEKSLKK